MADVTASGYLVLKATRKNYGSPDPETRLRGVESAKITQARQSRPRALEKDEILIKVAVQIPAAVFDPITPSALIIVPEDLVLARHEIEVTAEEESGEEVSDGRPIQ